MEDKLHEPETDEGSVANEYLINTGSLFFNEWRFRRNPSTPDWKKCPADLADELEETLQEVLLKLSKPDIVESEGNKAILRLKFETFMKALASPDSFTTDYFVVSYDRPLESIEHKGVSHAGDKFFYLFSYRKQLPVNREMVENKQFEILMAFAVRQCDLMQLPEFLNFHLEENWNSDIKSFSEYFKKLTRKYGTSLFTDQLSDSVYEWIKQNENKNDKLLTKKIQTVLTVHQLAYLFRALVENKLMGDDNKSQLITWVSENFESKERNTISRRSLDAKFHSRNKDVIDFWADQFDRLSKFAASDAQKIAR